MQFVYTAKSKAGDIQTGHMTAADVEAVKRALREQSLFPIDMRKKAADTPFKALFGSRDTRRTFEAGSAERDDAIGHHDAVGRRPGLGVSIAVAAMQQSRTLRQYSGPGAQGRDGRQKHFGRDAGAGGRVWRRVRGQRGGGRSGRQAARGAQPPGPVSADGDSRAGNGADAAGLSAVVVRACRRWW